MTLGRNGVKHSFHLILSIRHLVKKNILLGDDIDLYQFPIPHYYPLDGGPYYGTAHFVITKDPDSGWVNLGTYRGQLFEKDKVGTQFIKGKHADIMLKKYQALGEKMPVASISGCDPLLFIMGASTGICICVRI